MASPPTARSDRVSVGLGAATLLIGTFFQAPGRILPETKLDVLIDPLGFLGRALHLWDPSQSFGQVQNQAAGYLLPMGPLYALGHALGVPPWVVQRLWIGGLLAVGFWGVARLARSLGIGTPASRLLGAAAYVLGAGSLTLVALRSGTQVPFYALPWVLVPLVEAPRHGLRRAAARSAVAVALMGGVNGTATVIVLAVPVLWFLTRQAGPFRRRLAAWWVAGVVAATMWWFAPLALQGRYGYAFAGFTESATITTSVSSATEALRGTGNWLAYLTSADRLWLPGGWEMIANRAAIAGGLAAVAVGMAGLTRRDLPERRWLTLSALSGLLVMVAGYRGPLSGPFSGPVRTLLDGPLVAFRNVNKAAPVLALPLALAGAHLLGRAQQRLRGTARQPPQIPAWARPVGVSALLMLAALAVATGGLPFLHGRAGVDGTFAEVPSYWRQAGAWLDHHAGGRRSIVLPASSFGEYTWGRPLDEPLASYTDQPLAVRDIVPLGSNGTTRLLDGIDDQLRSGRVGPGLAAVLKRSGVSYLVVRNDLDPQRTNALPPAQIRALLGAGPGLARVAAFGPEVDGRPTSDQLRPVQPAAARSASARLRAVEVYRVNGPVARVAAYTTGQSMVVSGEPEALYDIADAGLLDTRGTVLAGDPQVPRGSDPPTGTITDSSRRRDVAYGDVRSTASYTLTADQTAPGTGSAPGDRLTEGGRRDLAVAQLHGAASLSASSYAENDIIRRPADQPWAAFDGDPSTGWWPGTGSPKDINNTIGAWIELTLDQPRDLRRLTVTVPTALLRSEPTSIAVHTDGGTVLASPGPAGTVTVALPPGATRTVRLTIERIRLGDAALGGPSIAEVQIPGLAVTRPVATPTISVPVGTAPHVVLTRAHGDPFARDPSSEDSGLDRVVTVAGSTAFQVRGTAVARPGDALDALLAGLKPVPPGGPRLAVHASSRWNGQPAFAADRAVDGDPATSWVAADDDPSPTLSLRWQGTRTLDQVAVTRRSPPSTVVDALVLTTPSGQTRRVPLRGVTAGGTVRFEPLTTDQVTVSLARPERGQPVGSAQAGQATGLAELRFPALADLTTGALPAATPFSLPCGSGPPLAIDGTPVPTKVDGTIGDLLTAQPLGFATCGDQTVKWAAGAHRVTAGIGGPVQVDSLVLGPPTGDVVATPASTTRSTTVHKWGAEHRSVAVGKGDEALLALTENANHGWRATLDGKVLTSTRVDGWRQAWIVPTGTGGLVTIDFAPDGPYRAGLLVGLLLLVGLAGATVVPARRRTDRTVDAVLVPRAALPVPLALGIVAVVGAIVGGWAALLALPLLLLPNRSEVLPAVAAAAVAGAAIVVLGHPGGLPQYQDGSFSPAAQALAVLAIIAAAVSLVPDTWPARLRGRQLRPAADSIRSTRRRNARRRPPPGTGTAPGESERPDRPAR